MRQTTTNHSDTDAPSRAILGNTMTDDARRYLDRLTQHADRLDQLIRQLGEQRVLSKAEVA